MWLLGNCFSIRKMKRNPEKAAADPYLLTTPPTHISFGCFYFVLPLGPGGNLLSTSVCKCARRGCAEVCARVSGWVGDYAKCHLYRMKSDETQNSKSSHVTAPSLYIRKRGSKHQDQLCQSDSAARKTQTLIHTGGADRATHVSSVVLRDKFGRRNARKRNKIWQGRKKFPFFTSTFLPLSLTATTIFLLGCQLSFGERISHKEGCYVFPSSTCSQRKPRSGSRI